MTQETKAKSVSIFDPDITLQHKGDLVGILSSNGGQPSSIKAFDSQFQNSVDYLIKITHERFSRNTGVYDAPTQQPIPMMGIPRHLIEKDSLFTNGHCPTNLKDAHLRKICLVSYDYIT